MLYTEPTPRKTWYVFIALVFALLYLVNLAAHELRPSEALQIAVAQGMLESGNLLAPSLHGEPVTFFPLYAWLTLPFLALGLPVEWAARLPAVLAILALAGMSARMAAWAGGHLAGAVAACAAISSLLMLGHGPRAAAGAVFAVLVTLAWFSWYRLGRIHRRWGAAWILGLTFAGLACFSRGTLALVYFYLPLVFLRRPLRINRRFWLVPHIAAFAVVALVVIGWQRLVPEQSLLPWDTRRLVPDPATGAYWRHLIFFPIAGVAAFMPWSVLVWPAFCVAFRPAERTPILSRFLRTLVVCLGGAVWLLPAGSPSDLLPLIGPLAVLTGLYYDVLLRRYAHNLRLCLSWLPPVILALATASLVLIGLHAAGVVVVLRLAPARAVVLGSMLLLALCLAWWVRQTAARQTVWARLLVAMAALVLVYQATWVPLMSLYRETARASGALLVNKVPAGTTVYKLDPTPLLAECVYLHRPVRRISNTRDLPAAEPQVFVLGGPKAPILETRSWSPCSPAVPVPAPAGFRLLWRPAFGCLLRVEALDGNLAAGTQAVRLYRGELRPAAERMREALPQRVNERLIP